MTAKEALWKLTLLAFKKSPLTDEEKALQARTSELFAEYREEVRVALERAGITK